jgi:hypothetical protein
MSYCIGCVLLSLLDPLSEIGQSLVTGSELANETKDTKLSQAYAANASALKININNLLWDGEAEMFRDNVSSHLLPQDRNALAILFNVTQNQKQVKAISKGLTQFWTEIGPLSPELNDTIIPFIGGFEVSIYPAVGKNECRSALGASAFYCR